MTPTELQQARQSLGLSQAQLGAAMGVRGQTVSEWEREVRTPSDTAQRLLRAYIDGYRPPDWPTT